MNKYILSLVLSVILAGMPTRGAAEVKTLDLPGSPIITLPESYLPKELESAADALQQADYDKCIKVARAYLSSKERKIIHPERARLLIGLASYAKHDFKTALSAFKKAVDRRRSSSDFLVLLGQSYVSLGQAPEAVSSLEEALWFGKHTIISRPDALWQLGQVYVSQEMYQKARESFKSALATNPEHVPSQVSLANLYLMLEERPAAIALLSKAFNKPDINPRISLALAKALLQNADRVLQRDEINRAKTLTEGVLSNPESPAHIKQDAIVTYVRSLIESNDLKAAEHETQIALSKLPDDPRLLELKQQIAIEKRAVENKAKATQDS